MNDDFIREYNKKITSYMEFEKLIEPGASDHIPEPPSPEALALRQVIEEHNKIMAQHCRDGTGPYRTIDGVSDA